MPSNTDLERAFYGSRLGYSDNVIAGKSLAQLRADYIAGGGGANSVPTSDATALSIFYPEAHGAKGDGVTDDTAAIQAAVDAACSAGNGIIQFAPKNYVVNGAPRTDRQGNAIIALPTNAPAGTNIIFRGATSGLYAGAGTYISTTRTDGGFVAGKGAASIIGGPTPQQRATTYDVYPIVDGLHFQLPANPTYAAMDFIRTTRCKVRNTQVNTGQVSGDYVQPTTISAFGLRLPDLGNYGDNTVDDVAVFGMYCALVNSTSHSLIRNFVQKWCYLGQGLIGSVAQSSTARTASNTSQGVDPHASVWDYIQSEWCTYHIGGYLDGTGLVWLLNNERFALSRAVVDFEDAVAGKWYSTTKHISDGNSGGGTSGIFGRLDYTRVAANAGVVTGPLLVDGSYNLEKQDRNVATGLTVTPAMPASTTAVANSTGRTVVAYIGGGTVTSVVVGGISLPPTSGAFLLPPGTSISITYSAAPTWIWQTF